MVQKSFAAAEPQIKSYDPIWSQVRREAEEISAAEPALGGFIYATVLDHARLEDAVCHRLARRLQHSALDTGLLHKTFNHVLAADPRSAMRSAPTSWPPSNAIRLPAA